MWQLILGPVLGVVGGWVQKWQDSREKAAERAHELAVMDREAEYADRRLKIEQEIAHESNEAQTFTASYQFANDRLLPEGAKLTGGQKWLALGIDALTRSIRPLATIFYQLALVGVFVWSALELQKINGGLLDPKEAQGMVREIIYSIIGTAETTLFWWFGIRGMSRSARK